MTQRKTIRFILLISAALTIAACQVTGLGRSIIHGLTARSPNLRIENPTSRFPTTLGNKLGVRTSKPGRANEAAIRSRPHCSGRSPL